jgi:hypothetical protein
METVYIKTPLGIAITGDVNGVSEITVKRVKCLLKSRFCEMQCSNFKNISILKELILPLNSIQKELIFNKSLERITRYSVW